MPIRRNRLKSEKELKRAADEQALRAARLRDFTRETKVDPTCDPFIAFAFEGAAKRKNHLELMKLANQLSTKGAALGNKLLPKNDFGFRGSGGKQLWKLLEDALNAPHGQRGTEVRKLQEQIKLLQDGRWLPTPKKGESYAQFAPRTFVFSLLYLRNEAGLSDWSLPTLYDLACGLGIAHCYSLNAYGKVRLSQWSKLVKEVRKLRYETADRTTYPDEAYYLAATVSAMTNDSPEDGVPDPGKLVDHIKATQLARPPLPSPPALDGKAA